MIVTVKLKCYMPFLGVCVEVLVGSFSRITNAGFQLEDCFTARSHEKVSWTHKTAGCNEPSDISFFFFNLSTGCLSNSHRCQLPQRWCGSQTMGNCAREHCPVPGSTRCHKPKASVLSRAPERAAVQYIEMVFGIHTAHIYSEGLVLSRYQHFCENPRFSVPK